MKTPGRAVYHDQFVKTPGGLALQGADGHPGPLSGRVPPGVGAVGGGVMRETLRGVKVTCPPMVEPVLMRELDSFLSSQASPA